VPNSSDARRAFVSNDNRNVFSPIFFFFSKEEGTDGKRGVFDFIEKEILANA
jgi:hypothetical protein